MSVLAATASRLARQDMLQGLTVLLAAMCLILALRWPTGGAIVNDSWFYVAPVRTTLLAFGGLAWGAGLGSRQRRSEMGASFVPSPETPPYGEPAWRREVLATLVALVSMVAITAPFDVLAHAATYPGTSLGWSVAVPFLAAAGFLGIGLLVGRATRATRTVALLPLLVPGILAGSVWLDLAAEVRLLNPWFAATDPSPWFACVMAVFSVVLLFAAFRRGGSAP